MKPLQIYACGEQGHVIEDALPDLKALTQQATGKAHRRIGRFIQLALIGAARCQSHLLPLPLPANTGVYFASARGDRELGLEIMTQLFREGQSPKPLNFVNTVSNAACFYIAQTLGLQSRSNFVCNRYFAFESALQLAALDLQLGIIDSALVGSVDIATLPLNEHRQRLQLAAHAPIGEGSHWLWLGKPDSNRPRLGELHAVRHFTDRDELSAWLVQQTLPSNYLIAAGQSLSTDDFFHVQKMSGLTQGFDHHPLPTGYDSLSGSTLLAFLNADHTASGLLHINADHEGRYSVMLIIR